MRCSRSVLDADADAETATFVPEWALELTLIQLFTASNRGLRGSCHSCRALLHRRELPGQCEPEVGDTYHCTRQSLIVDRRKNDFIFNFEGAPSIERVSHDRAGDEFSYQDGLLGIQHFHIV